MITKITQVKVVLIVLQIVVAPLALTQETPEVTLKAIGVVKSVDREKNNLTLTTNEGKTVTVNLSSKTTVTKTSGAGKADISDVKVGELTQVQYKVDGTKRIATTIEVIQHRPGGCPNGQPCPDDKQRPSSGTRSTEK